MVANSCVVVEKKRPRPKLKPYFIILIHQQIIYSTLRLYFHAPDAFLSRIFACNSFKPDLQLGQYQLLPDLKPYFVKAAIP
jgi:hypothetical protein